MVLYQKLIYKQTGKSLEHLSVLETIVHLPSASCSCIRIDDTVANYLIGDQIVGVHHTCVFATKRVDPGLSK